MTPDELVLGLLRAGRLRVCLETGRVEVYVPSRKRWEVKQAQRHYRSGRAWYNFRATAGGKKVQRTVYANRLIKLARDGFAGAVVDHRDGDRHNDSAANLQDHTRAESDRQGREAQRRRVVEDAENYFDWIAFWGEEPPDVFPIPSVRNTKGGLLP